MTGPDSDTGSSSTRPISVAELLARNGTVGAPAVTRRRRRRRGDSDTVTVAELTAEIPVIRDQIHDPAAEAEPQLAEAEAPTDTDERPPAESWAQPVSAPVPSEDPLPPRRDIAGEPGLSRAEAMSPDPATPYAGTPVEVSDAEVRDAGPAVERPAGGGSPPWESDSTLFGGGQTLADELARRGGSDKAWADEATGEENATSHEPAGGGARDLPSPRGARGRLGGLWLGTVAVVQSVLAVALGAGLFLAFDQLWRWNSIVALVLSVLVILGLVVGVRVVRKTEDTASTLIAVAVGALTTLGPLALSMRSG